jgi:hypothetical protein
LLKAQNSLLPETGIVDAGFSSSSSSIHGAATAGALPKKWRRTRHPPPLAQTAFHFIEQPIDGNCAAGP